jgi:uroporphyrinogen decarboxylase
MNSYERVLTAVFHGEPDCVPVTPYMGNYGAKLVGVRIDEYCRSGKLMAEAQLRALDMCDQDAVVAQSDNYYIAEGFGVKIVHHPDGTPTAREPLIKNLKDILKLRVPDPLTDGRMPVYLEAISRLADEVKGERIIRAPGTGPFSLAGHLMTLDAFLMTLAMLGIDEDEDTEKYLSELLRKTTEALIRFQKACVDAGADMVQAGDSLASLDMISPAMYTKWVFPYEKKFFQALNSYGEGNKILTLLHICGDTTKILTEMADTEARILEIDSKVDLGEAKRLVGERSCLMGNIEPSAILLQGTPAEVERKCQDAIDAAGTGGGFLLGSGCEVPPLMPLENMHAMVKTARRNTYPLAYGDLEGGK